VLSLGTRPRVWDYTIPIINPPESEGVLSDTEFTEPR
jgi:hypothetical protein